MKQTGNVPTGRSGHTVVTFGKVHYMFGGIDSPKDNPDKSKILPKNELYTLRITNTPSTPNNAEWSLKQCTGEVPLARAYHAACKIGEDRMLIFGGYYTSSTRFNDSFYLKISRFLLYSDNLQWFQPPNQKSVGEPKNSWSKIGAPEPRANHTATYHKGKVYVFGGHGGVDYKRVAFNDIYELDVENEFKWEKIATQGTPPEPRGGHIASILSNRDKLIIFGGWNYTTQFQNIFIYNIDTKTWEDPEVNHEIPKWNLGGIMAPSIPSWKYFIFGGTVGSFFEGSNRTSTKFSDDTWYLQVDSL
jgi:dynein heavy chain